MNTLEGNSPCPSPGEDDEDAEGNILVTGCRLSPVVEAVVSGKAFCPLVSEENTIFCGSLDDILLLDFFLRPMTI